jgi:hypothetical protein
VPFVLAYPCNTAKSREESFRFLRLKFLRNAYYFLRSLRKQSFDCYEPALFPHWGGDAPILLVKRTSRDRVVVVQNESRFADVSRISFDHSVIACFERSLQQNFAPSPVEVGTIVEVSHLRVLPVNVIAITLNTNEWLEETEISARQTVKIERSIAFARTIG